MMRSIALAAALAFAPSVLNSAELETTHLFGFTLGTDVNDVGEIEGEVETLGRFAKRDGSYAALSQAAAVKFIPFQDFSIEPGAGLAYHDISGVPGLDDRRQWAFETLVLEMRYRVLNRRSAPFGLTLGMDPHWTRVDDVSREPVDRYGAEFLAIIDRELIEDRYFAAFNLLYEPDATRPRFAGGWQHQSNFGTSAALSAQVQPGILIGAEARHLRSYDGQGLGVLTRTHVVHRPHVLRKVLRTHLDVGGLEHSGLWSGCE
jgi:hypothetical protein